MQSSIFFLYRNVSNLVNIYFQFLKLLPNRNDQEHCLRTFKVTHR